MIEIWKVNISLGFIWDNGKRIRVYGLHSKVSMYFPKYGKTKTIDGTENPFFWNGADKAIDTMSLDSLFHDEIVGNSLPKPYRHPGNWFWDDGTPITVAQSSHVLDYINSLEGRRMTGKRRARWTFVWQAFKHHVLKREKGK